MGRSAQSCVAWMPLAQDDGLGAQPLAVVQAHAGFVDFHHLGLALADRFQRRLQQPRGGARRVENAVTGDLQPAVQVAAQLGFFLLQLRAVQQSCGDAVLAQHGELAFGFGHLFVIGRQHIVPLLRYAHSAGMSWPHSRQRCSE